MTDRKTLILMMAKQGEPQKAIAALFSIDQTTVSDVLRRNGVFVRHTDDPRRLKDRERWRRAQAARRARMAQDEREGNTRCPRI